jgi:hypothetical protein
MVVGGERGNLTEVWGEGEEGGRGLEMASEEDSSLLLACHIWKNKQNKQTNKQIMAMLPKVLSLGV